MAKLVLSQDGVITREFPLEQDMLTIGRKSSNDIQIDDISVSGAHARVMVEQNFYMESLKDTYIEDLDSTNGTYVNGNKIKKHMLRHGDIIQIGRHDFKFFDEEAPDFDKTVVIQPITNEMIEAAKAIKETEEALSGKPAADSGLVPTPAANSPVATAAPTDIAASLKEKAKLAVVPVEVNVSKKAFIKVLTGPKAGKELQLVKSYTSMGNGGTMIVIAKRQQGYFVSHVSGKSDKKITFPTVNDNPVGAQSVPLQEHDVIDIGGLKLEFAFHR